VFWVLSKVILERNLKVLLSKYYFDRNCSICEPAVVFIMSPPPQPNQLVDLFSPNPTIPPSGRSTPSSVGGAASGRASALTIDSSSAISWVTQGIDMTIRPIPKQGSISYFDPDALNSKKPSGREKGAATYSSVEHVALLSIMSQVPNAFNCSKSSPQWDQVYQRMIAEFYQAAAPRLSSALHGHFVDLYGSFKLGIRNLSQVDTKPKCPVEYKVEDDACMEYVEALNNLLSLDLKKYNSKKWWSRGIVELLLQMHLEHTFKFGAGKQTAGWLSEKASMHKTKFEMDQKNRLDDLAKKRKAEEDECRDAARLHQTLSAASEQLVEAFKSFTTPPAQAENVGAMVEQKMAMMKMQIMDEIGAKMEESNKEVKDTLTSILDLLHNRY
jgi:hypothetical protein